MRGLGRTHRDPGAPFDEAAFVALYRERFVEFHLAWSVFFISHLSMLHRRFGDIEDALLLAAIGMGPVAGKLKAFQASQDATHLAYAGPVGEPSVTNAVRLSELTGIPRQTVRRKLQAFAKRGWIEQTDDRSWRLARQADNTSVLARDLSDISRDGVKELAQLLGRFDRLMRTGARNGTNDRG